MKRPAALFKNILWQVLARFGVQILAVLFTVLLARRMGSAGFGVYAFLSALLFLGNALTTFGTDMLLIREIAGAGSLARIPAALALQLAFSFGLIALAWLSAPFIPNPSAETLQALRGYSFALIPMAFSSIWTILLRGKQRMDALMALNLVTGLLQLAGGWFYLGTGAPGILALVWILLGCQLVSALAGLVLCAFVLPRFWQGWHFQASDSLGLLRSCAPLGGLTLISILYQRVSILMLAGMGAPALTGWYSGAVRAVEAAKTVHLAAFTALYPALAQDAGAGEQRTSAIARLTGLVLLGGALAASLLLSLGADGLTRLILGDGFGPSAQALKVLAWILLPFTLNTWFSLNLLARLGEKHVARVQTLGLLALLTSSAVAIPRWGLMGACSANLLAEVLQAAVYLLLSWRPMRQARLLFLAGGEDGVSTISGKAQ